MTEMKTPRGFTLLHLVLALTAMTTLASVGIPAWFSKESVTLDNAAELLARDLRDAQDRAAFQHRSVRVEFDRSGDGYKIVDSHGEPLRAPVGNGDFERVYSRDAVFRGVIIESVDTGPEHAIHFGARGVALNGGQLVISFGDERRHMEIEPTTGDVTVDGEPVSSY